MQKKEVNFRFYFGLLSFFSFYFGFLKLQILDNLVT